MKPATWSDRLRYRFDNVMAKGTPAMLAGLGLVSLLFLILFSVFIFATGVAPEEARGNFVTIFWLNLLRTLDPGTMGADPMPYGLVTLGVTGVGIFLISALIGIINSGIGARLDQLRKGRSRVIERDHTVILGWSDQVYTIVAELAVANQNRRRPCVVILGERDPVEMADAIRDRVGPTGNTRVVCRQGDPMVMGDLDLASLDTARSIIILSPDRAHPDADVIKTMLAIVNNPGRKREPYHLVAEIRDPKNMAVAKMVGKDEVELVLVGDLIARIIAQTCRQAGLSLVYTELLDFGGDEIYFQAEPGLVGKTFGETLFAYADSTVLGIARPGEAPRLNPPMDTVVQPGDRLICISEDDDTIRLSGTADYGIATSAIRGGAPAAPAPERTLILGWNWRVPTIVCELDAYVAPGSSVTVAAGIADGEAALQRGCLARVTRQQVSFRPAETTDRSELDRLGVADYHHVILLCDEGLPAQEADARALITLLHLRDIGEQRGKPFTIVSEMLDIKNRDLAQVARVNDFIVSDKLISLLLTQISENKQLNAVFADLFDPDGSEIYLKPAAAYVQPGVAVNFYTVVESARRRGEVAIGYKRAALADNADRAYGVVVNPDKEESVTFSAADRVIVLAES